MVVVAVLVTLTVLLLAEDVQDGDIETVLVRALLADRGPDPDKDDDFEADELAVVDTDPEGLSEGREELDACGDFDVVALADEQKVGRDVTEEDAVAFTERDSREDTEGDAVEERPAEEEREMRGVTVVLGDAEVEPVAEGEGVSDLLALEDTLNVAEGMSEAVPRGERDTLGEGVLEEEMRAVLVTDVEGRGEGDEDGDADAVREPPGESVPSAEGDMDLEASGDADADTEGVSERLLRAEAVPLAADGVGEAMAEAVLVMQAEAVDAKEALFAAEGDARVVAVRDTVGEAVDVEQGVAVVVAEVVGADVEDRDGRRDSVMVGELEGVTETRGVAVWHGDTAPDAEGEPASETDGDDVEDCEGEPDKELAPVGERATERLISAEADLTEEGEALEGDAERLPREDDAEGEEVCEREGRPDKDTEWVRTSEGEPAALRLEERSPDSLTVAVEKPEPDRWGEVVPATLPVRGAVADKDKRDEPV